MRPIDRFTFACVIGAAAAGLPRTAAADMVWSAGSGAHSAAAEFSIVNARLQINLSNTSVSDATQKGDILTAVFFDVAGATSLTPVSAVVGPGSSVLFGNTDPGGVVGGEWGYRDDPITGFSSGISASRLNGFGPRSNFPGSNLSGGANPGGIGYGLTSAGDSSATGTADVTGKYPLIRSSAVFTLSGIPAGFDLSSIRAVQFWYGNSTLEPQLIGTAPAPGAAALICFTALAAGRRRSRSR